MKALQLVLSVSLVLGGFCSLSVDAQNPKLNKYTPGEGLDFSGNSGYSMSLRGYIQPYFDSKSYTSDSLEGAFNRFRLRRLRLRLTGESPQHRISYRLQFDLSGTSEIGDATSTYLMDAWVAYHPTSRIQIRLGQGTDPTNNRELTMGSQTLQLVERSRVTSAFATIREVGIFAQGRFRTGGGTYLKPYLIVTNGDGGPVMGRDRGGLKVGGRLDFLPFGLFTNFGQFRQADMVRELAPKLVIGTAFSKNHGMSSRRGRESGAILYLNDMNQESLPDFSKLCVDFLFKYRGFSMIGEFVSTSATVPSDITQRVRNDGSIATTFDVDGKKDVENYVKGRMMLGKGYHLMAGYMFKNLFSIDARYTQLDADQHSFLNNGTFYNRPKYYTLGISKYQNRNYAFKIQASMTYVELSPGSNDIYSTPVDGNEWIGRIITSFAF